MLPIGSPNKSPFTCTHPPPHHQSLSLLEMILSSNKNSCYDSSFIHFPRSLKRYHDFNISIALPYMFSIYLVNPSSFRFISFSISSPILGVVPISSYSRQRQHSYDYVLKPPTSNISSSRFYLNPSVSILDLSSSTTQCLSDD